MRKVKFVSMFVLLALLLSVTAPNGAAQANSGIGKIRWLTYTDSRYGFSIEYPANWHVTPRDDRGVGGTVSFNSPNDPLKVEVGLYLAERTTATSLKEWTDQYDAAANAAAAFEPTEIQIKLERFVRVDGQTALRREGVSPLTEFKYTNVPWGKTVWFIWTNSDDARAATYDHMVASFRFGKNTPATLQEAYGSDFQPLQLDCGTKIMPEQISRQPSDFATLASDPAGHRLPFIGYRPISTGPGCYYTHQGQSYEAIDYSMPVGTPVLASFSGWIGWHGWVSGGWGNLLTIHHGSDYVSWYAHLNSFRANMWSGQGVSTGCLQAYSGNTGDTTGAHLHFEVRLNDWSVWIRTLPTTVWDSGDPNNPCQPPGYYDGYATGPTSPCYP